MDDFELPFDLRLERGETWQVLLPGGGSAGLDWQVEVDDSTVVEVDLQSIEPDPAVRPGGLTTYNIDRLLTLRAARSGTTTVSLRHIHPWETDEPPLRDHTISVVVDEVGVSPPAGDVRQVTDL